MVLTELVIGLDVSALCVDLVITVTCTPAII